MSKILIVIFGLTFLGALPASAATKVCVNGGSTGLSVRGADQKAIAKVPIGSRWCGVTNYKVKYRIDFGRDGLVDYVDVAFLNGTKGYVAKTFLFPFKIQRR
ncbi:MAG: hypothetical protein KME42_13905 [Tildeniella nuda ZEHNDER 1965/U140]|jgi:hypothetical protein|nr:hypothetical protein [Tildeniella nuda ZEHNDER 1965/U140]